MTTTENNTKEKAKIKIIKLVQDFDNTENIDNKSENQIKSEFIDPLFEALGWDMRKDAEREERILKGSADYVLSIGNQKVAVIEAKRTSINLSEKDGGQAVNYAYHNNIKFAILTNFKELRIYHALSNIRNINKNLLKDSRGEIQLFSGDFETEFDRLWIISKESFKKREINKLLSKKDERTLKSIDQNILTDLLKYREWLSKDLKNVRTHLLDFQIDEIVQILIDRLIFIRSVEDRKLEEHKLLEKIVINFKVGNTTKRIWETLIILFKDFDDKYNSKLFSKGLLEEMGFFSEETLIKVINGLYYGTSGNQQEYNFNQIPGDILGNIYEQYLGTILQGTEKRIKLKTGTGKRKKMGIFYTPPYIVDHIVRSTVGEYIKNKTIDEILEVKILDPACGSGSFLLRAFDEVCTALKERMERGQKSEKYKTFNLYEGRLKLSHKITALTNCIFGVDLDEKAVELAQLNLLLKLLEDEDPSVKKHILPNMKGNIKCGNSLIEDREIAGDSSFMWEAQFTKIFKNGGFDIIIGNPPWSSKLSNKINCVLAKKFEIEPKNVNICTLFVLRSLKILNDDGIFGFLLPKVIIKNEAYYPVRKKIVSGYYIKNIFDFGQFPGVASDSIGIIILNKKNQSQKTRIEFYEDGTLKEANELNQKLFNRNQGLVFSLNITNEIQSIIDKINIDTITLGSSFKIKRGIELGQKSMLAKCEKCFTYNETGSKYYGTTTKKCKNCGKTLNLDENLFSISSGFPNEIYKEKAISGTQLKRYLISSYYYIPTSLKGVDYKRDAFDVPKILIKRISTRIEGTYAEENLLAFNTVYSLFNGEKDNDYTLFILGILNSKLINFFYEYSYNVGMNLTTQVTIDFLSKIPIKEIEKTKRKKLCENVKELISSQKQTNSALGRAKERLEQQIKQLDWQIDKEVYEIYGLTQKEQKIIEESMK